ncbi:MAG: aromatic amino acid transport family protein [Candidatus Pacebacteria bacterium]|nr:aromatic amino acid transport family protein [Candidatus Paceibacterota bacterium]
MRKNFLFALSSLVGVIIGAGIFGIPYAISKSGVIPGLFYFLILGGAVLLLYLFVGEIVLRTEGKLRLIGYAQKYLGNSGKVFITISTVLGLWGALLAYIILGGDFLKIVISSILPSASGVPSFYFALFFSIFLSFFVFQGMKFIAPLELFTNTLFFFIVFFVFCFGSPKINFQNFDLANVKNLFLPYGVILFSLAGWTSIPEIADILKSPEERKKLKKVIIFAMTISIFICLLFSFTIVGISGKNTSFEALQGLVPYLGPKVIFFGAIAAVITLADSFLILGLSSRNTLLYDYKIPKKTAALISCGIPLVLFLAGLRNFIGIIGTVGTIIGAIEGIVIIFIFKNAKKLSDRNPEYNLNIPSFIFYFLVLVFILGAVLQFFPSLN